MPDTSRLSRPALRRTSPLRFVATLFTAVLCSAGVLGGMLALFDHACDSAQVARAAPASDEAPAAVREVRAPEQAAATGG